MAQAETILQQRIDCLDRKLPAKQLEELSSLVRLLGFRLTPIKAPKPNGNANANWRPKFRGAGRGVYIYRGISAAEAKGPTLIHKGKLCPGSHLWPQDIAAFYAGK